MKILFPTDFSKFSKVAIHYGAWLASQLNAEMILLHAITINAATDTQSAFKTDAIFEAKSAEARQELSLMTHEIKALVGDEMTVSFEIVKGFSVADLVETFAVNNDIDLIILGTMGASGLKKVLMGSNATAVIAKSSTPVICVPAHTRYKKISQIVYASDLNDVNKEMKTIVAYAQLLKAAIHLLHVVSPLSKKKVDGAKIASNLISKFNYPDLTVSVVVNDNVEEAIDSFIASVKGDLLVMFTHNPSFLEKLFGKSITREMAFHNWIPLLTFKKKTNELVM